MSMFITVKKLCYYYQSVLPKGRSLTANSGTKAAVLHKGRSSTASSGTKVAVLPKGRSSTTNSGTTVAVLLGMNRCSSSPLLSAPHSLFSIWTDLERSFRSTIVEVKEWMWLSGPSGLHRNLPQGLNISSTRGFDQIRDPEIPITLRSSNL